MVDPNELRVISLRTSMGEKSAQWPKIKSATSDRIKSVSNSFIFPLTCS